MEYNKIDSKIEKFKKRVSSIRDIKERLLILEKKKISKIDEFKKRITNLEKSNDIESEDELLKLEKEMSKLEFPNKDLEKRMSELESKIEKLNKGKVRRLCKHKLEKYCMKKLKITDQSSISKAINIIENKSYNHDEAKIILRRARDYIVRYNQSNWPGERFTINIAVNQLIKNCNCINTSNCFGYI